MNNEDRFPSTFFGAFVNVASVSAEETYRHFPSVPSPDLTTALCNLQSYNDKLTEILSKDKLDAVDMAKIHELTYTLEDAVAQIQEGLTVVAENLESVHKASERIDQQAIDTHGSQYIAQTKLLTEAAKCD